MDKNIDQFARDLITLIQITDTCNLKIKRDSIFCPSMATMVTRMSQNVTLLTLSICSSLVLYLYQKRKLDTFTKQLSVFDRLMFINSRFDVIREQQKLTGFLNPISPFLTATKALRYVDGLRLYSVGCRLKFASVSELPNREAWKPRPTQYVQTIPLQGQFALFTQSFLTEIFWMKSTVLQLKLSIRASTESVQSTYHKPHFKMPLSCYTDFVTKCSNKFLSFNSCPHGHAILICFIY